MSEQGAVAAPVVTVLGSKAYDILKYLAQIVFPALGALYYGLAQIWGFPNGEEVVGTITLIDVALGGILLLSSAQYAKSDAQYDGSLMVNPLSPEESSLQINTDLDGLAAKSVLTLKVQNTA